MLKISVQSRIWGMVALFVVAMLVSGLFYISSERTSLLAEKKLKTQQLVELVVSQIDYFYMLSRDGVMTDDEAKAAVLQSVRAMRYSESEYFWIQDATSTLMIMHATQPRLDGQRMDIPEMPNVTAMQAGTDRGDQLQPSKTPETLVVVTNQLANSAGAGFVMYQWPRMTADGPTEARYPKLSFVKKFAPWNWVVGTGIFIDDIDHALREKAVRHLGWLTLIGSLLALTAALLARGVVRPLQRATRRLEAMSQDPDMLAPLPKERNDEIGALIDGYNQLQLTLKAHESRLRLAASVFDNALEGIIITDADANIIQVNPSFVRLTGYSAEEVKGQNPRLLASGKTSRETYAALWNALNSGHPWKGELINRRKDGQEFTEFAYFAPVMAADGSISHFIGIVQDITAQKALAAKLEDEAHHDYLTGLANRRHFIHLAEREFARARRYGSVFSIAMLDLDHFKAVNDTYGHVLGDEVLKALADTCREVLRNSDLIGRFGGEEFVILLPLLSASESLEVADRLREAIAAIEVPTPSGDVIRFTASFGIAEYQATESTIDDLLKRADDALYQAKHAGRNRCVLAGNDAS